MTCARCALLLLLVACTDAPPVEEGPSSTPDTGLPWQPERPGPGLSAEEVAARIDSAMAPGFPDPILPRDTLVSLLQHGDPSCPQGNSQGLSYVSSFYGCTATSGYVYAGIAEYSGGSTELGSTAAFHLLVDGFVIDDAGERFVGGGEIELSRQEPTWDVTLGGSWGYPPAGAWMSDPVSLTMGYSGTSGAEWTVEVNGGYDDGRDHALWFDELAFNRDCTGGSGTLGLREEGGYWYTLRLSEDCSGCGELSFEDGSELGEACVSLGAQAENLTRSLAPR